MILEIRSEYFHGEWPETPPPVLIGERTAGSSMLTRECEDPFAQPDAENAVDSALVADRAKKLEREGLFGPSIGLTLVATLASLRLSSLLRANLSLRRHDSGANIRAANGPEAGGRDARSQPGG